MPLPVGGFIPLPLAMMMPFMGTQSLIMMESAGKAWQYGKRKISAMSNEEFNAMDFKDLMTSQTDAINAAIPELKQQMIATQDLQNFIVLELLKIIPNFIKTAGADEITRTVEGLASEGKTAGNALADALASYFGIPKGIGPSNPFQTYPAGAVNDTPPPPDEHTIEGVTLGNFDDYTRQTTANLSKLNSSDLNKAVLEIQRGTSVIPTNQQLQYIEELQRRKANVTVNTSTTTGQITPGEFDPLLDTYDQEFQDWRFKVLQAEKDLLFRKELLETAKTKHGQNKTLLKAHEKTYNEHVQRWFQMLSVGRSSRNQLIATEAKTEYTRRRHKTEYNYQ